MKKKKQGQICSQMFDTIQKHRTCLDCSEGCRWPMAMPHVQLSVATPLSESTRGLGSPDPSLDPREGSVNEIHFVSLACATVISSIRRTHPSTKGEFESVPVSTAEVPGLLVRRLDSALPQALCFLCSLSFHACVHARTGQGT